MGKFLFESIGDRYHMYMVNIMFRWDQGTDFKMKRRLSPLTLKLNLLGTEG